MKCLLKYQFLILLASITLTISCDPGPAPAPVEPEINWKEILPGQYSGELEIKSDLDSLHYSKIRCADNSDRCKIYSWKWDSTINTTIGIDVKKTNSGYEIIFEKNEFLQWDTITFYDKFHNNSNARPAPKFLSIGGSIEGSPDLSAGCTASCYGNDSIYLSIHYWYFVPTDSARNIRFQATKPVQ